MNKPADLSFLLEEKQGRVVIITLNRPHVLNALSKELTQELVQTLQKCEQDPDVSVVILMGHKDFFAAGVDIHELSEHSLSQSYCKNSFADWKKIAQFKKPLIGAISGYALGGGCELALMCDILVAAENAVFGQPEVFLGTPPGGGATQRLPRLIGKARTMDLCLTGRRLTALEAERWGLVSRVVPTSQLREAVLDIAQKMGHLSLPALMMVKEAIQKSAEAFLPEGLDFECQLFEKAYGLEDRHEGVQAFLEKRPPVFQNK